MNPYTPHPDSLAARLTYARQTSKAAPPPGHEGLVRLTQKAAAILCGMSTSTLGRYESGEQVPSVATLRGILAIYGTERDDPKLFEVITHAWVDAPRAAREGEG